MASSANPHPALRSSTCCTRSVLNRAAWPSSVTSKFFRVPLGLKRKSPRATATKSSNLSAAVNAKRQASQPFEQMSHLAFFRLQVSARYLRHSRLACHAFRHANPRFLELPHFLGVVGKQPDFSCAQLFQYLRRKIVIPRVRRKAQRLVRLHRIHSAVLQFVRPQLVHQPDPAPLLRQIQQNPRARFADFLQRKLQLRAAIAAQRRQHVPRQALRVHAHQRRHFSIDLPAHQRYRFLLWSAPLESINRESPKLRRQRRLRHQFYAHFTFFLRARCFVHGKPEV